MDRSRILKLACMVVLTCNLVAAPGVNAQINCVSYLTPCYHYLLNGGVVPGHCCQGVVRLNAAANTTQKRRTVCKCLKDAITRYSRLNQGRIQSLPTKCSVAIPYTISKSIDCSKVK